LMAWCIVLHCTIAYACPGIAEHMWRIKPVVRKIKKRFKLVKNALAKYILHLQMVTVQTRAWPRVRFRKIMFTVHSY